MKSVKYPSGQEFLEKLIAKFSSLPKSGKPIASKEWTVLAGVLIYNSKTLQSRVVALGTGSKCISASSLRKTGFILNDSHAEVLARRALLRYCYAELKKAIDDPLGSKIFKWEQCTDTFTIDEDVSFHFVSTYTPCGDACIVLNPHPTKNNDEPPKKQFKNDQVYEQSPIANEIIYTGGRLIGEHSDSMVQTPEAIRTKPGRGERTLSVSCSDKLAKWNIIGWQGGLLYALIKRPLYFNTLTFPCESNEDALKRAIISRWQNKLCLSSQFRAQEPEIRFFELYKNCEYLQEMDKKLSPCCIAWCDLDATLKPHEISVNGIRQGTIAKRLNTVHAALKISKFWLLNDFISLIKLRPQLTSCYKLNMKNLMNINYITFKQLNQDYQNAWLQLKSNIQWTEKPKELLMFSLEALETMTNKNSLKKKKKTITPSK